MFAKIRHVAAHTERYDSMAKFYQTIFGMKQITTGLVDETGQHNPNRGHISDGVIGFALLTKRPGSQQGLDHFGFECEDVNEVLDRIKQKYPGLLFTKALSYVPFAGIRAQDPAGTQFDLSQKGMSNVREGYLKDGWEQHDGSTTLRSAPESRMRWRNFIRRFWSSRKHRQPMARSH